MSDEKKQSKDHSAAIGLGTTGAAAAAGGGTMVALTGASTSASAITYALGAIGGVVGGGMTAGLVVLIAGPAVLGGIAYGTAKAIKSIKKKKAQ